MSGEPVTFLGDGMAAIIESIANVTEILGQPPVVVGGLAVLCRVTTQHRVTADLDLVDRLRGSAPQLQVLRAANGAESLMPAAALLPTRFGKVRVDVLEVRQNEIDAPSDDPGDRLHASAHAWAYETASAVVMEATHSGGGHLSATTLVAEPGPLVAMKLQAVMDRDAAKQGTDLQDIIRLSLDPKSRGRMLGQISTCGEPMAHDIAWHVDHWLVTHRSRSLAWIRRSGGADVALDDLDLTAELLLGACRRV